MPNRIKELRAKNKMYQDTLARLVGSSQQTISKIENDKMAASSDLIVDIAMILNTSLDYMMCQTKEFRKLEYNEKLETLANEHSELLNLLSLMDDKEIKMIYLLAHAIVEEKTAQQ